MKRIKNLSLFLLAALVSCLATVFAAACEVEVITGSDSSSESAVSSDEADSSGEDSDGDESTGDYDVIESDSEKFIFKALVGDGTGSVYDALTELQEESYLTFDGYESDYGYYITKVNGTAEAYGTTDMTYWGVYTDLTEYDGVTYAETTYGSYTYAGTEYAMANYGVSYLPVYAGYTYVLAVTTYTY